MKQILEIHGGNHPHWVGDGFPVRTLFSYDRLGQELSPFLLLDHAGPAEFEPTNRPRGVGSHPHRGFETVTVVYQGEVAHRDSTGDGGVIGPGDVQWMTAGAGILHEEFHSPAFTASGGPLEMVQLWVNLPARHKMTTPGYQALSCKDIPVLPLPGNAGSVRLITGDYNGKRGPAKTFSPLQVWDVSLVAGAEVELPIPGGWSAALLVRKGSVITGGQTLEAGSLAVLAQAGSGIALSSANGADILLLAGEPLDEPIVGHGPFVMNSQDEIARAIIDFNTGRFGQMPR